MEILPNLGAVPATDAANEPRLNVRQPHVVGPVIKRVINLGRPNIPADQHLQMLRLIRAFQKLTDQDTRQMIIRYVQEQVEKQKAKTNSAPPGCRLSARDLWAPAPHNFRFVAPDGPTCDADSIFASRRESPMRLLLLPYLGIGLCASLAAWLTVMLLY